MTPRIASLAHSRYGKIGIEIFKFLAVGLPAFAVAFPLNYLLVQHAGLPKWVAYAIVLLVQVHINFPLCRRYVFEPSQTKSIGQQYLEFMSAIVVFRGIDWLVYTTCAEALSFQLIVFGKDIYYLVYQLVNVILFSLAKFAFCKRAIEGSKAPKGK